MQRYAERIRARRSLWLMGTFVVGLILAVVWALLPGSKRARPEFYEAGAQIIPVIILAVAVEQRYIDWEKLDRLAVIAMLVLGEIAALTATALGAVIKRSPGDDIDVGDFIVACPNFFGRHPGSTCDRRLTDSLATLTALSLTVALVAILWSALSDDRKPGATAGSALDA